MLKLLLSLFVTLSLSANNALVDLLDRGDIDGTALYYPDKLSEIYAEHNGTLLWQKTTRQVALFNILQRSDTHGLSSRMFHDDAIIQQLKQSQDDNRSHLKLDLLLSDAFLHYIDLVNYGALDPKTFYKIWNLSPPTEDITVIFEEALQLQGENFHHYIEHTYPQHFIYQNSYKALEHYIDLQDEIETYPPIHFSKTLKPGDDAPVITEIAHRLFLEGDLKEDLNTTHYDKRIEKAMKHYQDRHGLKPDGIIGKATAAFFKTTLQEQIDKLAINLERARWVLHDLSSEYVIVNIASYRLYYIKDGIYQFTTPVIVGKKMHETPIFTGKMRYIVYNPTWTVPHSIGVKELLHKAQSRKGYLDSKNLELLNRKYEVVDHHNIDFKQYNEHNFPYIFRQKPGNHNALGRIKFLFPNRQAIYLHDTPAKFLFGKDKREFSHGCIRVSHPYKLAESILKNHNMWSPKVKALEGNSEKQMKTTTLTLKHTIDVLLMYWSAGADKEGNVYFYKDHYHLDPALTKKLHQAQNPKKELL